MPVYQVDVEKRVDAEFFSNRYFVNAQSLTDAHSYANQVIVDAEMSIMYSSVQFTKLRTSVPGSEDAGFISQALSGIGAADAAQRLPLFNVLTVLFNRPSGRPCRKLYRGILNEGNTSNGTVNSSDLIALNTILGQLVDPDTGGTFTCDEAGNSFTSVTSLAAVGMRQLRRGKKRKATPILP